MTCDKHSPRSLSNPPRWANRAGGEQDAATARRPHSRNTFRAIPVPQKWTLPPTPSPRPNMSAPLQRRPRAASADVAATAIRIRRDVWSLNPWDDVLLWYSRAVERMQQRPASDPTSWAYQAAIHGLDPTGQDPQFWDQCQHQTWHFLPWHRSYLNWFEQIVQATIRELGGPHTDWALPYWNYSDVHNPHARVLPPAFRDRHRPDGHANAL